MHRHKRQPATLLPYGLNLRTNTDPPATETRRKSCSLLSKPLKSSPASLNLPGLSWHNPAQPNKYATHYHHVCRSSPSTSTTHHHFPIIIRHLTTSITTTPLSSQLHHKNIHNVGRAQEVGVSCINPTLSRYLSTSSISTFENHQLTHSLIINSDSSGAAHKEVSCIIA